MPPTTASWVQRSGCMLSILILFLCLPWSSMALNKDVFPAPCQSFIFWYHSDPYGLESSTLILHAKLTSNPRRRTLRVLKLTFLETVIKSVVQYMTKPSNPSGYNFFPSTGDPMSESRLELVHSLSSSENMGCRVSSETGYLGGHFSGGPINIRIFCKSCCSHGTEGKDSTTVEHLKWRSKISYIQIMRELWCNDTLTKETYQHSIHNQETGGYLLDNPLMRHKIYSIL